MKRLTSSSVTLLIFFLFFTISCNLFDKNNDEPESNLNKNIETGTSTEIASSSIATTGGSIKISNPETPVNGMEINIPANSFSSGQTVKVSYSEIKSHQFGQYFNPISPMITVSCDGGYSNDLMSITIPVSIPEGHIPLGFFLDETTGKLEGIPFKSITANSITLLTRHFLSGNRLKSGNISLKSASEETNKGANIIISSISESVLNLQPVIASGFKPGTDDWEFVNYGSYTATGGHCAGQNMTAMWYYFEKKPSEGNLFNRFSDNPKLWQDNARGYRFCSVIHNDLVWDGLVSGLFDKYIDKNQEMDKLKLLTIAGTMLVTGEPQGIGIYVQNGVNTDGTPSYGGHDLICYQVSVSGGKLYISDPNTPGAAQTIDFASNKFKPYVAKLNGNAPATPFPFVTYYAKTAYIDWDKIGKRYAQLLDNTIGTIAPNIFPAYTIWVKDKIKDYELTDGITVTKDTLRTYVECPAAVSFVTVNGKRIISSEVYDINGIIKSKQDVPGVINWSLSTGLYVKLTPGLNKLGYAVTGWNSKSLYDNSTERIPLFIDFKWINVNYSPNLTITTTESNEAPVKAEGVKNMKYTFVAKSGGTAAKNAKAKFEWSFGDGGSATTVNNDSTIAHTFTQDGSFAVKCILYNDATKITEGTATAKINSACPASVTYMSKTYNTVVIGDQCWLKENLDVGTMKLDTQKQTNNGSFEKYCMENKPENCTIYGGLYQWNEAMQYATTERAQGICPSGWHIPTYIEFQTLNTTVNRDGNALKAIGQGVGYGGPGTNKSGFSALFAGIYLGPGSFGNFQSGAFFWSSTMQSTTGSSVWYLNRNDAVIMFDKLAKTDGFSIRCIKN